MIAICKCEPEILSTWLPQIDTVIESDGKQNCFVPKMGDAFINYHTKLSLS